MEKIYKLFRYSPLNPKNLENIISNKIISILYNTPPLDLIAYNIENYKNIDKNLLNSIKQAIEKTRKLIAQFRSSFKNRYNIYGIYSNYYKNINETDRKNLEIPFPLNKEQIDLCKKIDKIEEIKNNHINELAKIDEKIKKIEMLIKIKIYQKENANLFKKNKKELKNILKEMIKNFKNQNTNLVKEHQRIIDNITLNYEKSRPLRNDKEKLEQELSKEEEIYYFPGHPEINKAKIIRKNIEKINEELKPLEEKESNLNKIADKIFKEQMKVLKSIDMFRYMLDKNLLDEEEIIKLNKKNEESLKLELEKLKEKKYKLNQGYDIIIKTKNTLHLKEVNHNNKIKIIINENNTISEKLTILEEKYDKIYKQIFNII